MDEATLNRMLTSFADGRTSLKLTMSSKGFWLEDREITSEQAEKVLTAMRCMRVA
jgi:hypothetical protein